MPTASRTVIIRNSQGLHARPAMQFVDVANQFRASVMVHKGGDEPADANGKSVMDMLVLAAGEGTPLLIEADGDDAAEAIQKLAELIEAKFGEE
jgi:phosphotransferase system HPr (HPr) family protein